MISDIQKTAELDQKYSFEAWKALLVDEFEQEMARNSEGLTSPGEVVLSFDKKRMVTIRPNKRLYENRERKVHHVSVRIRHRAWRKVFRSSFGVLRTSKRGVE